MSKTATILGLVAAASASWSSAQGYPASGSWGSSSAAAYGSSSDGPVSSSSAPSYPSSSDGAWSSSSAPVYGSSSFIPSSTVPVGPVSSSSAPSSSGTPTPDCWSKCFSEGGVTSESDLCGNDVVSKCIHDTCCKSEDQAYWAWYDSYCTVPSSSVSATPSSPVSSSPVTLSSASATPTADCWSQCFAKNDITSESELCGNTDVDQCIQDTCSCEEDKAYWAWYDSFCTATPSSPISSSASVTSPSVPASSTADCWGKCFAEAGIASESELCGNTAVDECIHDTCSCEEDKAYWQWYNGYCGATTTASISIPTVTATPVSSSPATATSTADCWTTCFADNGVTSESALCGNAAVSACIHDTCSASLDKAYWDWYNAYCSAETTSVVTITGVPTVTATATDGYSTGPAGYSTEPITITVTIPATPVESSPVTTLPTPYGSIPAYGTGSWGTATGTSGGYPAASSWAPVPATGAGEMVKPGMLFAAAMAVAALF